MNKNKYAIVSQDTSTSIARSNDSIGSATPWGAIASITDSITNVINVWTRERNITERVRLECNVSIEIAKKSLEEWKIRQKAWEILLEDKKKDRIILKENLDKFWMQIEIWDNKFKDLNLDEMKKHEDLLNKYMEFKKDLLTKIENMFSDYYKRKLSTNLLIEDR